MRNLILCCSLMALVSCGQQDSSSSKAENEDGTINGYLDLSSGLVGSSDLLTVTLDVPATVGAGVITFQSARSGQDVGNTITCSAAFAEGETYSYSLSGLHLTISTPAGQSYTMRRMGAGNDIIGSWSWSGIENGMHIHRRFTIPNTSRLIMNMDCES